MGSSVMDATPEGTMGDLTDLPSSPCSDIGDPELSPDSKKILERFALPASEKVPILDLKSKPSLILRPKTSGVFAAGSFQFAKPTRPANNFSIRPCNKKPTSAHQMVLSEGHEAEDTESAFTKSPGNVVFAKATEEPPAGSSSPEQQKLLTTVDRNTKQLRRETPGESSNYRGKDGDKQGQPPSEQNGQDTIDPSFDGKVKSPAKFGQLMTQSQHASSVETTSHLMATTPQLTNNEETPSTNDSTTDLNGSILLEDTQLTSPCRSPDETPSKEPQHRAMLCKGMRNPAPALPLIMNLSNDNGGVAMEGHDDRSLELKPTAVNSQARAAISGAEAAAACQLTPLITAKDDPKRNIRRPASGHGSKTVPTPCAPKTLFGPPSATKITKRLMPQASLRPQSGASRPGTSLSRHKDSIERPPINRGPSEEDLFMMLIGRLKKRDEIETFNRITKERLQKEVVEASQKNVRLSEELKQAEELQRQQEARLKEQQEMIERWKAKFCKLKDLADHVGTAFEDFRNNGKQLKETQHFLLKQNSELQRDLQQIQADTEKSQRDWRRYIENVGDVKKGVIELQTSVVVAKTQAQERDRAIREERCRVAKLENHIRTYCIRQLKETSAMYDMENDIISRIKYLSKAVESLRVGASGMGEGMGKDIGLIIELLKPLSEREIITTADLSACQGVIEEKWSLLKNSVEESCQRLEGSLSARTPQGDGIMSKLAHIEESFADIFQAVHVMSDAQDSQKALQAKLDSAQQSLTGLNQECERLRSNEHALKLQAERMVAEMERLRKKSDEAADIRTSEAFSNMQRQLEEMQAALTEASAQIKLEESALHAMREQAKETAKRAESAETEMAALKAEKAEIEARASQVELSIRQELTRASLAAKEQNKAWLDQEKYKLQREKQQGEKVLEAMKQQLEMTTASLEKANGLYEAAVAKEKELKKQNDDLKKTSAKSERELQAKVKNLEDAREVASKAKEIAKQENHKLRENLEQLQAQLNATEEFGTSAQKVSELDNALKDKAALVSSLQDQLQRYKTSEEVTAKLRQELDEKTAETNNLHKQLDDITAASSSTAVSLKLKDAEISELLSKLTLAEKERDSLQRLQTQVDEKQSQLDLMHGQRVKSDTLIAKMEALLHRSGLLCSNQSLLASWDTIQSHFEQSLLRARRLCAKESDLSMAKATGKRKRSAAHFEFIPETKLGECSTREVIYQTCRIRESASPKKVGRPRRVVDRSKAHKMEAPPIKPFSQLQDEARLSPGTPPGVKDLDLLLFSTPIQEQQPQEKVTNLDTQSTKKSTSENMLLDEIEASQSQGSNGDHKGSSDQMRKRDSEESVQVPATQLQESMQPSQPVASKRGIYKDSTTILGGQTPRAIRTPNNKITGNASTIEMAVNGAFRRPTRMGSKFFDPLPPEKGANLKPPAQAGASVSDEVLPVRPVRKTRGRCSRKKGNYNDRFLKELKN